ncbi:UNVERIFIED_CONTAM: hypothetical protein Scaly_2556800 [Sesamum calycinum]|uniref:MULE transposase domain-containing protein n=1 Tax=Sesamum calycinum TaxID=2727403 RepID=A0AAW2L9J9_9LAMI
MALRSRRLNHLPPLQYAVNDHYVNLRIHNGGELVHTPVPEYLCGTYQINREIVLYLDAIQDTPEFDYGPNEPPAENEKEMEIFEANDWETIFKILDIVAEGAEGDAVRGGDDAVRYGKGNREVEVVDDDAENRGGVAGDASSSSEFISNEDIIGSGDDFGSEYENEEGDCKAVFNASEKYDPNFEIGMIFSSKYDFKDVVAKRKALNAIDGAADDQFALLWDYAEELMKRCRRIIGVDGCHLKGPHGGVLLTAVSIDPINNLYPLAYAIVSGETREAWEWFLGLLKSDLNIVREDAYTFISDKQKGLIPAFESVFPGSDKRYCVRHLHGNMKTTGFKGLAYKSALWNAARATTESEFKVRMEEMIKLNERVVDWLSDKPPVHWSRAFFNTFSKCDILLNNVCESFNSCILEAREKPFLTMLEWIREFIMLRLTENRDRAEKKWFDKKICPKIRKILDKNMDKVADCIPIKSDQYNYEISCYDGASQVLDLEDFVNPCYSVQTFKRVYRGEVAKEARKSQSSSRDNLFKVKCHYCGGTSHNQKGCDKKKEDRQNQPQKKLTARKRTISTPILQSQEFISVGRQPPTQGIQSQEVNVMEEQVGSKPPTQGIQSQEVNVMEEQVSHPLRHIFSQYSNVNEASRSGSQVNFLTKGRKRFVTMTNLPAAIHATKKKKPNT